MPSGDIVRSVGMGGAPPRRLPLGVAALVIALLSGGLWFGLWQLAARLL